MEVLYYMDYNKRNDCNKINSMSCMRIYHVPGPQGPTERLFKSSNRIIIDSS